MADTKAKPAAKAERKTPVRKAPKLSDYSTRLEWLAAMVKYEEEQAKAETNAKVARLDKRIATVKVQRDEIVAKLTALITERDKLAGVPESETAVASDPAPTEDETTAG